MKARLILATVVAGGLALAVGGTMALAGKPAPDTSKYPDLRTVVPDAPESREPAAERVPAVLERHREHGRRAVGDAAGERARRGPDDDCVAGDPLVERPVPVRDAAEGERPLLHDPLRAARLDLRVPPDAQPLAYRRRRPLRGAQGQPDRKRGRRELAQGRLLPPRPVQHSTDNAPTSQKTFWDCYTSYQGVSVGWVDQYHQSTDGQQVDLTGVPNATDYYLVSTTNPTGAFLEQIEDEQHRVGEVHALGRLEREPQGDRDGYLPVQQPGALRRALDEPLTSAGRGRAGDRPAAARLL